MEESFQFQEEDQKIFEAAVERLQRAGWFGATLRSGGHFQPQITDHGFRRFKELQRCLHELNTDLEGIPDAEMKMILALTELALRGNAR